MSKQSAKVLSGGILGQHLRTVRGDFGNPYHIAIRNDRIYMIEVYEDEDEDEELGDINEWAGRRLLVLELDGKLHQEVRLPVRRTNAGGIEAICFRGDGELLIGDPGLGLFSLDVMQP